jgi:hypothetical protein
MNLRLAKSELISNAFLGEADKVVLLVTSRDFIFRMELNKIQKTHPQVGFTPSQTH